MNKVTSLIDKATEQCGTQAQLARVLGVPRSQITDWKTGRVPLPDKHLMQLARAAGQPIMATAMEVYKERLGELMKTLALGVGAIAFGSVIAAGDAPAAAALATDHDV
jgi:DNA-binding transcriptional regulator YdaS (Cro superfamily)